MTQGAQSTPLTERALRGWSDEELLALYRWQARHCPPYARWHQLMGRDPVGAKSLEEILFLPIAAFKHEEVVLVKGSEVEVTFRSSGTGGDRSRHRVPSLVGYQAYANRLFRQAIHPDLTRLYFLTLLPGYRQNPDSSLLAMIEGLARDSGHPLEAFKAAPDGMQLARHMLRARSLGRQVLLFGVTHALFRLCNSMAGHPPIDNALIVIETGGMKGHGPEPTRGSLHARIASALPGAQIYSEYGMTELLSQAYTKGTCSQRFRFGPVGRVYIADPRAPWQVTAGPGRGALAIVDGANRHSCAFIQTEDLAVVHEDQTFEVLGRLEGADVRGCNQLV